MLVAPSILAADFLNLGKEIEMLNRGADLIHLDVMDGKFVNNISFGFPVIKAVSKVATIPMDVHLMTIEPGKWFNILAEAGVRMVSFHLEAAEGETSGNLDTIHALGMKAGVVINPDVEVDRLFPYLDKADFFLIMSVFAGFGGQKFIGATFERVARLKQEIIACNSDALIEVDGGVNASNASVLRQSGADIVVAGSSVFCSDSPQAVIDTLRNA